MNDLVKRIKRAKRLAKLFKGRVSPDDERAFKKRVAKRRKKKGYR